jgi:DNA-binding PadR family transcriptional regulator
MNKELLILGIMYRKEKVYGYEIKKILKEKMSGSCDINFGSIYYAIKKSVENKLIKKICSEKNKDMPEKHVYSITPLGKKHYKKFLKKYFCDIENKLYSINEEIVLLEDFINKSLIEDVEYFLEAKKEQIKNEIKEINNNDKTGFCEHNYLKNHMIAEEKFYSTIQKNIEKIKK